MSEPTEEKLESQFILRLPMKEANKVKKYIRNKPKKLKKHMSLDLDPETRSGSVKLKNKTIPMKLVDLPTIVESVKTHDKSTAFKTADVCQMLVPESVPTGTAGNAWPHGLTAPLKNVKKVRMRRVSKCNEAPDDDVVKELKWLFQADSEAVSVRWELVDDVDSNRTNASQMKNDAEREIFGDILSDSETETTLLNNKDPNNNNDYYNYC